MSTPKAKKLQTVTINQRRFEGTFTQRQRRRKVFELRLRHYSIRKMAAELDVSVGAITRDLESIEWALLEKLDPLQATQILNTKLSELDAIKSIALAGLEKATGNVRIGLLNTALRSIEISTALLQDGGILPKATRRMELTSADGEPLPPPTVIPIVNLVIERSPDSDARKKLFSGA